MHDEYLPEYSVPTFTTQTSSLDVFTSSITSSSTISPTQATFNKPPVTVTLSTLQTSYIFLLGTLGPKTTESSISLIPTLPTDASVEISNSPSGETDGSPPTKSTSNVNEAIFSMSNISYITTSTSESLIPELGMEYSQFQTSTIPTSSSLSTSVPIIGTTTSTSSSLKSTLPFDELTTSFLSAESLIPDLEIGLEIKDELISIPLPDSTSNPTVITSSTMAFSPEIIPVTDILIAPDDSNTLTLSSFEIPSLSEYSPFQTSAIPVSSSISTSDPATSTSQSETTKSASSFDGTTTSLLSAESLIPDLEIELEIKNEIMPITLTTSTANPTFFTSSAMAVSPEVVPATDILFASEDLTEIPFISSEIPLPEYSQFQTSSTPMSSSISITESTTSTSPAVTTKSTSSFDGTTTFFTSSAMTVSPEVIPVTDISFASGNLTEIPFISSEIPPLPEYSQFQTSSILMSSSISTSDPIIRTTSLSSPSVTTVSTSSFEGSTNSFLSMSNLSTTVGFTEESLIPQLEIELEITDDIIQMSSTFPGPSEVTSSSEAVTPITVTDLSMEADTGDALTQEQAFSFEPLNVTSSKPTISEPTENSTQGTPVSLKPLSDAPKLSTGTSSTQQSTIMVTSVPLELETEDSIIFIDDDLPPLFIPTSFQPTSSPKPEVNQSIIFSSTVIPPLPGFYNFTQKTPLPTLISSAGSTTSSTSSEIVFIETTLPPLFLLNKTLTPILQVSTQSTQNATESLTITDFFTTSKPTESTAINFSPEPLEPELGIDLDNLDEFKPTTEIPTTTSLALNFSTTEESTTSRIPIDGFEPDLAFANALLAILKELNDQAILNFTTFPVSTTSELLGTNISNLTTTTVPSDASPATFMPNSSGSNLETTFKPLNDEFLTPELSVDIFDTAQTFKTSSTQSSAVKSSTTIVEDLIPDFTLDLEDFNDKQENIFTDETSSTAKPLGLTEKETSQDTTQSMLSFSTANLPPLFLPTSQVPSTTTLQSTLTIPITTFSFSGMTSNMLPVESATESLVVTPPSIFNVTVFGNVGSTVSNNTDFVFPETNLPPLFLPTVRSTSMVESTTNKGTTAFIESSTNLNEDFLVPELGIDLDLNRVSLLTTKIPEISSSKDEILIPELGMNIDFDEESMPSSKVPVIKTTKSTSTSSNELEIELNFNLENITAIRSTTTNSNDDNFVPELGINIEVNEVPLPMSVLPSEQTTESSTTSSTVYLEPELEINLSDNQEHAVTLRSTTSNSNNDMLIPELGIDIDLNEEFISTSKKPATQTELFTASSTIYLEPELEIDLTIKEENIATISNNDILVPDLGTTNLSDYLEPELEIDLSDNQEPTAIIVSTTFKPNNNILVPELGVDIDLNEESMSTSKLPVNQTSESSTVHLEPDTEIDFNEVNVDTIRSTTFKNILIPELEIDIDFNKEAISSSERPKTQTTSSLDNLKPKLEVDLDSNREPVSTGNNDIDTSTTTNFPTTILAEDLNALDGFESDFEFANSLLAILNALNRNETLTNDRNFDSTTLLPEISSSSLLTGTSAESTMSNMLNTQAPESMLTTTTIISEPEAGAVTSILDLGNSIPDLALDSKLFDDNIRTSSLQTLLNDDQAFTANLNTEIKIFSDKDGDLIPELAVTSDKPKTISSLDMTPLNGFTNSIRDKDLIPELSIGLEPIINRVDNEIPDSSSKTNTTLESSDGFESYSEFENILQKVLEEIEKENKISDIENDSVASMSTTTFSSLTSESPIPTTTDGFESYIEFSKGIQTILDEINNQTDLVLINSTTTRNTLNTEGAGLNPDLVLGTDIDNMGFLTTTNGFESYLSLSDVLQTILEEQNQINITIDTSTEQNRVTMTLNPSEVLTLPVNIEEDNLIPDLAIGIVDMEFSTTKDRISSTERNILATGVEDLTTARNIEKDTLIPDLALEDVNFQTTTDGLEVDPDFSDVIQTLLDEKNDQINTSTDMFTLVINPLEILNTDATTTEDSHVSDLALNMDIGEFQTTTDGFESNPDFAGGIQILLEEKSNQTKINNLLPGFFDNNPNLTLNKELEDKDLKTTTDGFESDPEFVNGIQIIFEKEDNLINKISSTEKISLNTITPSGVSSTAAFAKEDNLIPGLAVDIDIENSGVPTTIDGFESDPEFSNVIQTLIDEKDNQVNDNDIYATTERNSGTMIVNLSEILTTPDNEDNLIPDLAIDIVSSTENTLIPDLILDVDILDEIKTENQIEVLATATPAKEDLIPDLALDIDIGEIMKIPTSSVNNTAEVLSGTGSENQIEVLATTNNAIENLIPDLAIDIDSEENMKISTNTVNKPSKVLISVVPSTEENLIPDFTSNIDIVDLLLNINSTLQEGVTTTQRDRRETTPNIEELLPDLSFTVDPPTSALENLYTNKTVVQPPLPINSSLPKSTTVRSFTSTQKVMLLDEKISLFDALIPVLFLPDEFFDTTIATTLDNMESTVGFENGEQITVTESIQIGVTEEPLIKANDLDDMPENDNVQRPVQGNIPINQPPATDENESNLYFSELLLNAIEDQNKLTENQNSLRIAAANNLNSTVNNFTQGLNSNSISNSRINTVFSDFSNFASRRLPISSESTLPFSFNEANSDSTIQQLIQSVVSTTALPVTTSTTVLTTALPVTTSTPVLTTELPVTTSTPVLTTALPVTSSTPVLTTALPVITSTPALTTALPVITSTPVLTTTERLPSFSSFLLSKFGNSFGILRR
ncbi:uncharacterized threonine-rich GPI-anchored glycoprotein PJ4664.02 isoform X1 [Eurytemora carolleeae]|uniref:uncharacterized threonine-rich GPI-anchored glycoprotein PJ4664.02 isoform X1 n=1 Tax=Eurytemora carolleeae TaxID=1294199 RepID=UPI000C791D00|nr:uncharacterized threonine-rich GPI-anchored glycoprotein PJ4664.02 isoform X1 [Eurytemora carolleeae]|eukprot:XP_023329374.1 uncharacterized threonine-rich GPI-anchored glycoprotein PJ4664.02-like isoform X1 [Eurytemora affinis]